MALDGPFRSGGELVAVLSLIRIDRKHCAPIRPGLSFFGLEETRVVWKSVSRFLENAKLFGSTLSKHTKTLNLVTPGASTFFRKKQSVVERTGGARTSGSNGLRFEPRE